MLVRDSTSRFTSDCTLTVTCYILTLPSPTLSSLSWNLGFPNYVELIDPTFRDAEGVD